MNHQTLATLILLFSLLLIGISSYELGKNALVSTYTEDITNTFELSYELGRIAQLNHVNLRRDPKISLYTNPKIIAGMGQIQLQLNRPNGGKQFWMTTCVPKDEFLLPHN
jgi:hypothetical protein